MVMKKQPRLAPEIRFIARLSASRRHPMVSEGVITPIPYRLSTGLGSEKSQQKSDQRPEEQQQEQESE
jgi:hypothetical protein